MKKITKYLTIAAAVGLVLTNIEAMAQAQCSSASPLTIGANDATCNSQTFGSLGSDMDNMTPPLTALTGGNTCAVAIDHAASWYSFTGDGTTIRFKLFDQNQASRVLVFENATCGGSMAPAQCANFADDDLPHTIDINTTNGANYKIAVLRQSGSATMSGKVCAYKTNGLPYSPACDPVINAQAVNITVAANANACFSNFVNVVTGKDQVSNTNDRPTVTSGCDDTQIEYWWGKFIATGTKTELYLYGKDDDNASLGVASGPCGASMTSLVCIASTGSRDVPTYTSVTTVIGQEYYVLIKKPMDAARLCVYSSGPPETTKPFCTPGMSFEDGAGAGWVGKYGGYHLVSSPGLAWIWDFLVTGKPAAKMAVTSGTGFDPTVGGMVPVVAPGGGSYSFRLGSLATAEGYAVPVPGQVTNLGNQAACESMAYTFTVNASNAGFGYKYATIMDAPTHHPDIQPLFDVQLTVTATGAVINCGNYVHYPGDGNSPFHYVGKNSDVTTNTGISFTPWTDVITDLSGFAGQQVTATFRTRDCEGNKGNKDPDGNWSEMGAGSHFGYAYIDTYCIPIAITVPEYCAGTSSIQICAPPGYASYTWPAGQPGISGSPTTQCVTITNPSLYTGTTYTVNAVSITGCPVIATVKLKTIPLTVTTPATICPNDPATVSVSVDNPINPPYTFTWSHGLGTGAGPKSVNPAVTTTYTVTVTNGVGCSSTQAVIVNVDVCGINVTTTPTTICNGSCGTITASGASGTAPYTYSWNPGGLTGSNISVCPLVTTTYTVIATDNTGSTASATSVVTVNPKPTITLTGGAVCPSACATITAGGGTTYAWSAPFSGTGATQNACPSATSSYSVTGTDANGCTNTATATVTVNVLPTVTVTDLTICQDSVGTITASGANTYAWSCGGTGAVKTPNTSVIGVSTCTVTGTDANGCVNTAVSTITVNDCSIPNVNVPNGTVCIGNCFSLTAVGTGGVGTLTYAWSPNIGAGVGPHSVCPTVTSSYTVTVTDGNGATASDVAVVTVNPLPTIAASTATICDGDCAVITAAGGVSYTWAAPLGAGSSQSVCPTTTTSYSLTGTDANGCSNTAVTSVTVNPIPVITVPNASICPGGSTPLTASGATTYTWSPTTGLSSGTGTTVTANPAVTTTYTVCGTTNNCSSCTTVVVSVGALVATVSPDVTICFGASTQLTSGGGSSYSWTPATGLDNPNSPTPIASPTVTTTYTVVVSDVTCSDDAVVVVTVDPPVTVNVAPVNVTCFGACNGQTIVIPSGGNGVYSYNWSNGCVAPSCNNVCAGTYTLTVTDGFGCTATGITTVTEPPPFSISAVGGNSCPGDSIGLTVSGAVTYSWLPTTALTPTSGANVVARPTTTTTYTIVGTDASGCTAVTTVVATVNPKPLAGFTTSPDVVDEFDPTVYFTDLSSGGTINSWNWNFGDSANTTSSSKNPIFVYPPASNQYTVQLIVTNEFGCIDTVLGTVYIRGIFTFYIPNTFTPNDDGINDRFLPRGVGIDESDYHLWIFDRWGNLIWETEIWGESWDGKANGGSEIAQIDTYVWKVHVREKEAGTLHNYIGHVNIVK